METEAPIPTFINDVTSDSLQLANDFFQFHWLSVFADIRLAILKLNVKITSLSGAFFVGECPALSGCQQVKADPPFPSHSLENHRIFPLPLEPVVGTHESNWLCLELVHLSTFKICPLFPSVSDLSINRFAF